MRIPSLDGLRALSILLVLFGHVNGTRGFGMHGEFMGDVANLGVRVFFVISGFLITSLLLKEREVELGQFYWRRFYRIFPPFYFYLATVLVLSITGVLQPIPLIDIAYAAVYATNFTVERAWLVGHTWSLSVEEQFYLLWPGLLAFAGVKRSLRVALGVLALAPLVRVGWHAAFPSGRLLIGEAFPTVADSIATGCLLTGYRKELHASALYQRAIASPVLVPVVVSGLFLVNMQASHARVFWLVGETILNVGIAFLVDRAVLRPDALFGKILNVKPLARLGMVSYSLYLWQQVFLDRSSQSWFTAFPQNLGLALASGFAGFYLIEKPIMKYRDRLMPARRKPGKLDR